MRVIDERLLLRASPAFQLLFARDGVTNSTKMRATHEIRTVIVTRENQESLLVDAVQLERVNRSSRQRRVERVLLLIM